MATICTTPIAALVTEHVKGGFLLPSFLRNHFATGGVLAVPANELEFRGANALLIPSVDKELIAHLECEGWGISPLKFVRRSKRIYIPPESGIEGGDSIWMIAEENSISIWSLSRWENAIDKAFSELPPELAVLKNS